MILPETSAEKLLVSHGRVVGVRTGDKGRGRAGEQLGNFEPGSDLVAKVTVLAEGTQGHLTGVAIDRFGLAGAEPQVWELGVKEVWKVGKPLDRLIHTIGMRSTRTRHPVDQAFSAVHLIIAADFIELLAGIAHHLAGLADVLKFSGKLQQAELAPCYLLVRGHVALRRGLMLLATPS